MTTTAKVRSSAEAASDTELLSNVRRGDESAFMELYQRHVGPALRTATTYRCGLAADDLVSEAFERVLGAIRRGVGPTEAFRPYLYVTMRRLAAEAAKRRPEERLNDDILVIIDGADVHLERDLERQTVATAFLTLPPRSRKVLWHLEIEGLKPGDLVADLGISANAVSALAYRARGQLRRAYLQANEGSVR